MNFNNRTFHLLLKADILTCYEHNYLKASGLHGFGNHQCAVRRGVALVSSYTQRRAQRVTKLAMMLFAAEDIP